MDNNQHHVSTTQSLYLTTIMSWNDDVAYAMTPFKLLSLPLGGWPLQKYNKFALVRHIICNCSLTVMLIVLYLEIYYDCSDAYEKLDALMLIACGTLALLKISLFRIYANNLTRNYSSAISDYLAIDNEEKRTIMRHHAFMGRIICYSVIFFSYVGSMVFILAPMLASDKDIQVNVSMKSHASGYPIPTTCTLAHFHISTSLYLVIFTVQCILLAITCTGNLGSDSLFLAITLHVCGQVELLKIEFANFGVESKNINKDFSELTTRHCYLLNHAELLADAISLVLLMQLLISCILICIIGFQFILALKENDAVMIIKTIMVLGTLLSQLFAYSFVGDYLKYQVEEVAHSIYCSNWYCLSIKLMRNILFIITRSQQPVQLAAGKFLVVNIETYMTIIKTSLSYLSVLRVMLDT